MDPRMQARLEAKVQEQLYSAMESLAVGSCVNDSADGFRVEYSRDARLWLMKNPPPGTSQRDQSYLMRQATFGTPKQRARVADEYIERPQGLPPECYRPDGDARHMTTEEFIAEVERGSAELVANGWPRHEHPYLEWIARKAEEETGWTRRETADRSQAQASFERAEGRMRAVYYRALNRKKRIGTVTQTLPE